MVYKLWDKPATRLLYAVDTEYVQRPNQPNQMITTQLVSPKGEAHILEHPSLKLNILHSWKSRCIFSDIFRFEEVDELPTEPDIEGYLVLDILMFFAPSDLLAGLFRDLKDCRYIQRYCIQDARIRLDVGSDYETRGLLKLPIHFDMGCGNYYQYVLNVIDLAKIGQGSLKDIALSFGIQMENKSIMDDYKTNMLEAYTNPELLEDYKRYSLDDAKILFDLRKANNKRRKELFNIHGLIHKREILTTGSLVAKLLEGYLEKFIGEENKAFELFTKTNDAGKTKRLKLRELLAYGTVDRFAREPQNTKKVCALVQGGRAKNERPDVIYANGVIADPDLKSCYATILRNLDYPVGLPCSYGEHESSTKRITLEKFLKKNGSELLPRLYAITVSGKLKHHQTLVPSKLIDSVKITEKYNPDDPKIDADFRLYTQEIINGVITSDILEILQNSCSSQELKQWMNLEVVGAVWFPKSYRCKTPEEWFEKTKDHVDQKGNQIDTIIDPRGKEITIDNRSYYWLAVPIEGFLKPYAEHRNELKAEMKKHPKGSDEYNTFYAKQNAMKLVGNTLYGVLASPYFDVSSVCLANVITAAARAAVWCTATAAGSFQSITDGGAFDLNSVRDWHERKPNMNTLSLWRNKKLLARTYSSKLIEKPLGNAQEWKIRGDKASNEYSIVYDKTKGEIRGKDGSWEYFDEQLLEHVKHFFRDGSPISLLDIIQFEHKDIYTEIVIHSQTNYRFKHTNGEHKIKARGHKLQGKPYRNSNETFEHSKIIDLFDDLVNFPHALPPYEPQTINQILKCGEANQLLEAKSDNILKDNNLLAGDTIVKTSWLRPISLSMFHWKTDKQYNAWKRRSERLKNQTGWGIEIEFLNDDGSVDYARAVKVIQERIDDGENWVKSIKGKQRSRLKSHPKFNERMGVSPLNIS